MISKVTNHFRMEDVNGIVTVWIDVMGSSMNVFNSSVIEQLENVISELESSTAKQVVFRSAKRSGFFAGADVKQIAALKTRDEVTAVVCRGQELFARIARLPMPTVAAIHGPCLGGGLEFALACSHRIAMDSSTTRLGLPEVQLGLIPAWGGTQRLPRQIGLMAALPMILQGRKLSAAKALKAGLVDAVGQETDWDEFVQQFQPGRHSAAKPLVRRVADSFLGRWFVLRTAQQLIARDAVNYPALPAALNAVRAAFDTSQDGFAVERDEFATLIESSTCRNLLSLFFWREQARSGDVQELSVRAETNDQSQRGGAAIHPANRIFAPRDAKATDVDSAPAPVEVTQLAIIGAGAMGAGIGQLAALKGYRVVLKELDRDLAEAGMQRVRKLLDDMVARKQLSTRERETILARVSATDNFDDMSDCDLVIEAVVEKMEIKQAVFASLDAVLKPHAVIVSNTSALSVGDMASATNRPDRVAGLHFFNPVHRMDLVEVVRAAETSDDTALMLLRLVKKLGKTPVITSDSPGFLVNRVLFPYIGEAVRMVLEGYAVNDLDRDVKHFGMPMGPIELIDHVGLDVAWHVAQTLEHVLPESSDVIRFLGGMVARGWTGKKSGRGFYEYENGKRREANAAVIELVTGSRSGAATPDGSAVFAAGCRREFDDSDCQHPTIGAFLDDGLTDIQRRLIYPMINEVGFCMQDGVVAEAWMADLAMILGTGFAPFRGGPMTLADQIGPQRLRNNLNVLAARHGERFKPSAWLVNRDGKPRAALAGQA